MSKRGSRKLTVDGVRYRYLQVFPRGRRDGIVIQTEEGPGQKLVVELDFNVEFGDHTARPILPGFVAKLVRAASAGAWTPQREGRTFEARLRELLPDEPPPPHRYGLLMDAIEVSHPTHGEMLFECSEHVWHMATPLAGPAEPWAIWEAMEFLSAPPYQRLPEEKLDLLLRRFDQVAFIRVKARKTEHPSSSRYTDQLWIGPTDGQRTVFRFQCWPDRNYVAAGDWRSVFDRNPEDWLK